MKVLEVETICDRCGRNHFEQHKLEKSKAISLPKGWGELKMGRKVLMVICPSCRTDLA